MLEILSTLGGGLTGLLGTIVSGWFEVKKKSLDLEREVKTKELDLKAMEKEHEFNLAKAQIEAEKDLQESADKIMTASYTHDKASYLTGEFAAVLEKHAWLAVPAAILFTLVDFLRGIIRPSLTVYFAILTTVMYFKTNALLQSLGLESMNTVIATDMVHQIISMVLYLTSATVSWWFGVRQLRKNQKTW